MPQAPLYTTAEDLFTSRLMCGCSQHSATTNECVECTILQSCAGQPSCCHHICLQSAWRLQVYLDEEDKPEVGEGLNRAAEVTLHKVFKLDRATNRPSTAPADIEKYERKLKRLAASQSARFVSYNGRTGTWVFEVEHFSRQALHRACAWRSVSLRTDWLTGNACLPPEPIIKMSLRLTTSPYVVSSSVKVSSVKVAVIDSSSVALQMSTYSGPMQITGPSLAAASISPEVKPMFFAKTAFACHS